MKWMLLKWGGETMPYVIFSHYRGKYVGGVESRRINYTPDIDGAKVYKSKAGALQAVGEEDYSSTKVFGRNRRLILPEHFEIISVIVREGHIEEAPEGEKEEIAPDFEYKS